MSVVRENDLTFIDTPGGNAASAVATASRGATEVSVIRQRQAPVGANPAHTHDREEVMIVLDGRVNVTIDGVSNAVAAGDAVIVPAAATHQIENSGATRAEWLLIAPAGVRFFHADGQEANPSWAQ